MTNFIDLNAGPEGVHFSWTGADGERVQVRGDLTQVRFRGKEIEVTRPAAGKGAQTGGGACCIECDTERRRALPWPEGLSRQMIVCPHCGSKRCPRAQRHDSACTGAANPLPPTG